MIITVSRQMGSGGDELAVAVAARLALPLIDRDVAYAAARTAGLPDDLLQRLMYEGQRSLAAEVVDSLGAPPQPGTERAVSAANASPLLGAFAPMLPPVPVTPDEAARAVGRIIGELAGRGDALVLGQGGQMWLAGRPDACHIQVVAPLAERVRNVAQHDDISPVAARRRVRACDQARADYLLRYHNVNWLDPLLYHLVINTGLVSLTSATELVVQAARQCAAPH